MSTSIVGGERRRDIFGTQAHQPIPPLHGHDGDGGIREEPHALGR